ncbi:WD40 repeat domain-containing protein [Fimbriiglobus ruber]|uniref:High-affnity carbon uptake protein Hat/HatR n=1 Tax=Fimbriiglobus ruber TaxID=1908690 RepID=A0A225DR45_9BACT|nr:hypothetical protein [Fimbriiglobus ruber]OWK43563.1 High-affnity carbon uptake protein Hat/HatR [Fimbriiglobus ruber]
MPVVKRAGKTENRLRKVWSTAIPDHCAALAWAPDGTALAGAAVSGPITIFDAPTGKARLELSGHGFGTVALDWHPAAPRLASVGQDGKARVWDTTTGAEVLSLAGGAGWVERVAWSMDGTTLATAAGKKVRLWDAAGAQLREYAGHGGTVSDLAWRPGANVLAVAAYGGVSLYESSNPEPVRKFEWKGAPLKLAWSPDGKILAHGNQDATVHFWYADPGEMLQMHGFPSKVRELSWDQSSRFLANGGGPAVCVWDCGGKGPEGTKPQILVESEAPLAAIAWQRRGFLIAAGSVDGWVRLWQPANKKTPLIGSDQVRETAAVVAWSPDDKLLVVGAGSGAVTAYRVV